MNFKDNDFYEICSTGDILDSLFLIKDKSFNRIKNQIDQAEKSVLKTLITGEANKDKENKDKEA